VGQGVRTKGELVSSPRQQIEMSILTALRRWRRAGRQHNGERDEAVARVRGNGRPPKRHMLLCFCRADSLTGTGGATLGATPGRQFCERRGIWRDCDSRPRQGCGSLFGRCVRNGLPSNGESGVGFRSQWEGGGGGGYRGTGLTAATRGPESGAALGSGSFSFPKLRAYRQL